MQYSALDLIRLSLELENTIDPRGDLIPRPGMETIYLAINQYPGGFVVSYHAALPVRLRQRLQALPEQILLEDYQRVIALLADCRPASRFFAGISCYFARDPDPAEFSQVQFVDGAFSLLVDGKPVSRAWTQAQSPQAAELALETLPQFRRRGYGRQVAAAWGHHILAEGKVAFYSYRLENLASAALARSLGVIQYTRFTNYT